MSDIPTDIAAQFAEIVHETTRIPLASVVPGASFRDDLDIDSLSMVEIATATEDRFGIRISDEALADLVTVGDAIRFIQTALAGSGAPA